MSEIRQAERIQRVIAGGREFTFGTVLFHHAVAEILGVNVTDMECLALVVYRGVATPSELARHTGLSSGATTAMLDRLERSHLVERHPNPQDRRGTHIRLTRGATARLTALFGSLRAAAERLLSSYSPADLDLLSDFFEKIAVVWADERQRLQSARLVD